MDKITHDHGCKNCNKWLLTESKFIYKMDNKRAYPGMQDCFHNQKLIHEIT